MVREEWRIFYSPENNEKQDKALTHRISTIHTYISHH